MYFIVLLGITYVFTSNAMENNEINTKQNNERNHEVLWKLYTINNSRIPLHFTYADTSLAFCSFSYENTLEGKTAKKGQKERWHFLSKKDCRTNQVRKYAITLTEDTIETTFSWSNRDENNKKYGRKQIKRCNVAIIGEEKKVSNDTFCGNDTGTLIVSIGRNGEQDLPKPHICVAIEFKQDVLSSTITY